MAETPKPIPPDTLSIGDIYYLFFRHKWKILSGLVMGVLGAVVVFFLSPAVYRSEAKLLVRYVTDRTILDPASAGDRITAPGYGGENVINSEIEILSSRDLVEKVIDEMGIARFSPDTTNGVVPVRMVERIQSRIGIEVPKNSNVIKITFDGPEPAVSQEFLGRLTEAYLQKHVEVHRAVGAYEFLSQQTDQLRSRLAETEEELRKVKTSEGIVSIDEAKKNVAARIETLNKGLGDLEASLAAAKARVGVLKGIVPAERVIPDSSTVVSVATKESPSALVVRLQQQRLKEAGLLSAYLADSIPVRNIREQIAETERLINAGKAVVVTTNGVASSVAPEPAGEASSRLMEESAGIASLQATIAVNREILARTTDEAKRIDEVEARIVQLQRSKDLQEANYKYFSQSLEHARIDDALNSGKISNISVVQPATMPAKSLRPNMPKRMGLALFFGLVLGVGLAMLQEYIIDQTLRKPGELRAVFKVPMLMSVPLAQSMNGLLRVGHGGMLLLPAYGDAEGGTIGIGESVWQSDMNDYYEVLRDRLLAAMDPVPSGPCVLGVTSCVRNSGVSTLATGLALAFAQGGDQRVMLVNGDTDSLPPRIFGVNPVTGLAEMKADSAGNTAVTQHNHFVVPARDTVPPSAHVGYASRFSALIQHLRNTQTGYVIVDLPPVSETSLTLRVGRLLNGVVLVIAAGKVNRHVADRVKEHLDQADTKIIGTVLNKQRQYIPDWIYPTC